MSKRLFLLFGLFIFYAFLLFPQEKIDSGNSINKEPDNEYIEFLLDSGDYVVILKNEYFDLLDSGDYVVLINNENVVRVRNKPTVGPFNSIILYVYKGPGQYISESYAKESIDFKITEEFNKKLDKNRIIRFAELAQIEKDNQKELDTFRIEAAKLSGAIKKRFFTQQDLKSQQTKNKVLSDLSKVQTLNIDNILALKDYQHWKLKIFSERRNYSDTILFITTEEGQVIYKTTIKDLYTIQEELLTQIDISDETIQELKIKRQVAAGESSYTDMIVGHKKSIRENSKKKALINDILDQLENVKKGDVEVVESKEESIKGQSAKSVEGDTNESVSEIEESEDENENEDN